MSCCLLINPQLLSQFHRPGFPEPFSQPRQRIKHSPFSPFSQTGEYSVMRFSSCNPHWQCPPCRKPGLKWAKVKPGCKENAGWFQSTSCGTDLRGQGSCRSHSRAFSLIGDAFLLKASSSLVLNTSSSSAIPNLDP